MNYNKQNSIMPRIQSQKGVYIVFTAICLFLILSIIAIVIDLGRLYYTRMILEQVQEAAALRAMAWWRAGTNSTDVSDPTKNYPIALTTPTTSSDGNLANEGTLKTMLLELVNANLVLNNMAKIDQNGLEVRLTPPANPQAASASIRIVNYPVNLFFSRLINVAETINTNSRSIAFEAPTHLYIIVDSSPSMFTRDRFLRGIGGWPTTMTTSAAVSIIPLPFNSGASGTDWRWNGVALFPPNFTGSLLSPGWTPSNQTERIELVQNSLNRFLNAPGNFGINTDIRLVSYNFNTNTWQIRNQSQLDLPVNATRIADADIGVNQFNPNIFGNAYSALAEGADDSSNLCEALLATRNDVRSRFNNNPGDWNINFLIFSDGAIEGTRLPDMNNDKIPDSIYMPYYSTDNERNLDWTKQAGPMMWYPWEFDKDACITAVSVENSDDYVDAKTGEVCMSGGIQCCNQTRQLLLRRNLYNCAVVLSDSLRTHGGNVYTIGYGVAAPEDDVRADQKCNYDSNPVRRTHCEATVTQNPPSGTPPNQYTANSYLHINGADTESTVTCGKGDRNCCTNGFSTLNYEYCRQHKKQCCGNENTNCCGSTMQAPNPINSYHANTGCNPYQDSHQYEAYLRKDILLRRLANDPIRSNTRYTQSQVDLSHDALFGEDDCYFRDIEYASPHTYLPDCATTRSYDECYSTAVVSPGLVKTHSFFLPILPAPETAANLNEDARMMDAVSKIIWRRSRLTNPITLPR